jgi:hypothetical protein
MIARQNDLAAGAAYSFNAVAIGRMLKVIALFLILVSAARLQGLIAVVADLYVRVASVISRIRHPV